MTTITEENTTPIGLPEKIGGEFLVDTPAQSDQRDPTIASLSDGGFVVTWSDGSGQGGDSFGYSVKAQMFDAWGAKVGNEFVANTNW
jgi:hypothetical protein